MSKRFSDRLAELEATAKESVSTPAQFRAALAGMGIQDTPAPLAGESTPEYIARLSTDTLKAAIEWRRCNEQAAT